MLFEQDLQLEKVLHAIGGGHRAPRSERSMRGLHCGVDFRGRPGRRIPKALRLRG